MACSSSLLHMSGDRNPLYCYKANRHIWIPAWDRSPVLLLLCQSSKSHPGCMPGIPVSSRHTYGVHIKRLATKNLFSKRETFYASPQIPFQLFIVCRIVSALKRIRYRQPEVLVLWRPLYFPVTISDIKKLECV